MTTRLVIDTDPGVDDAHAIMMALAHPNTIVEAITTVAGNVSVDRTTANACTILDAMGADVPIYAGCAGSILGTGHDATYVHGVDGLGDCNHPPSSRSSIEEHAVLALIRLANAHPGELTLCAIGPLTNIAMATRLDPTIPQKFKRLVIMGGGIYGTGNVKESPSAEFNIFSDPEAAAIVFQSWPGLTLSSWETTLKYVFTPEETEAMMTMQSARGEFFRRITKFTLDWVEQRRGSRRMGAADGLAMAAALEPDIITQAEMHYVGVILSGARGQTVVDWHNLTGNEPNVNIVLEVNRERFVELFMGGLL
jgi:purine nucleosidase